MRSHFKTRPCFRRQLGYPRLSVDCSQANPEQRQMVKHDNRMLLSCRGERSWELCSIQWGGSLVRARVCRRIEMQSPIPYERHWESPAGGISIPSPPCREPLTDGPSQHLGSDLPQAWLASGSPGRTLRIWTPSRQETTFGLCTYSHPSPLLFLSPVSTSTHFSPFSVSLPFQYQPLVLFCFPSLSHSN